MANEIDDIEVKEINISDLKFTPSNPVKRTKRGRTAIQQSLTELGGGRSVLINEKRELIAGNGTIEQAAELGNFQRIIEVTVPDRNTIVAVKRTDLSEEEKYRMAMFDNASAKLAVWNAEGLCEIKLKGVDFDGILTEKEMDKITMPKKDRDSIEPEGVPEGANGFYVVVELDNRESQEGLYEYLVEEGYEVQKYDGTKKG